MAGNSCSSQPIAEINNVTTHITRNYNITGKFLVPENVQRYIPLQIGNRKVPTFNGKTRISEPT
jgi:hypothetical protein